MKDQIIKVIAEYLEKETVHAGTHNGEFVKFGGVINNGHFTHAGFCQEIAAEIAEKLEGALNPTPTRFDKNSLPHDVKLSFHKGVELYQCIQNYELGVFTKDEFIKEMRRIDCEKDYPYSELFDHMLNEHGLALTNPELGDIIHIARGK